MSISIISISLLFILCIALAFNTSLSRSITGNYSGMESDENNLLYRSQRAHLNSVEYAPLLAMIFYILDQQIQSNWVLIAIISVTILRYIHAVGILFPRILGKATPLKFIGALGTYILSLLLILTIVYQQL